MCLVYADVERHGVTSQRTVILPYVVVPLVYNLASYCRKNATFRDSFLEYYPAPYPKRARTSVSLCRKP